MTVVLRPHLTPCSEAVEWLLTQPDAETAWSTCDCPKWMLWLAERAGVEKPVSVRIACEIARTALHLVPEDDARPRLAIEAAEAWLDNPTEENTMAVDEAYWEAAYWAAEVAASSAADAAEAAAWAAYCADEAASWAGRTASWAARAASRAADAETADAAHAAACANCADIVRKHIPFSAVSHLVET